jgi:endonuclease/exonuclease/phosphatase family metal-dependent hydrolase
MKLKILSYNIHKGFNPLNSRFTLHQIKTLLQETGADIVFLQEVVGENKQHEINVKDWPQESQFEFLADTVWPHYSYGKNAIFTERNHGNAILSKFPIIKAENINISNNRLEQRGLLHCEIVIPELAQKKAHLFNVHLDLLHGGRMKQIQKIIQHAKKYVHENEILIIGGDFNDWNESLSEHFYDLIYLQESFFVKTGEYAKSFPSLFPFLSLDRVYFRHMKLIETKVLHQDPWSGVSDHLPLLVEFEVV